MMKTAELCRSRRVLENDTLIAKIGADTAANEPPKGKKNRVSLIVVNGDHGAVNAQMHN